MKEKQPTSLKEIIIRAITLFEKIGKPKNEN